MRERSAPWLRGVVSLAVLSGLVAAALMSPVGAAITKSKVKKVAQKQVRTLGEALFVGQGLGRFIENDPEPNTPLTTSSVMVLDLAASGQQITLREEQRVFAVSTIQARSTTAAVTGVSCRIDIGTVNGRGRSASTDGSNNYLMVLTVSQSQVLPAGIHNVEVECSTGGFMSYDAGNLSVWAV